MNIYVDSDAFPRPLREALCKASERTGVTVFFVAASALRIPSAPQLNAIAVGDAFNGADDWIVEHVKSADLVITADIPLADRALLKGATVLNTKGEFFTRANIKNALAMRQILDELRVSGELTGGPPPFSERTRMRFLDALNRVLQRRS